MASTTRVSQNTQVELKLVWEQDTTDLEHGVFFIPYDPDDPFDEGTDTAYRAALVTGGPPGLYTYTVDFGAVYDASADPTGSPAATEIPVGTYNVEFIAGKYDAGDSKDHPDRSMRFVIFQLDADTITVS